MRLIELNEKTIHSIINSSETVTLEIPSRLERSVAQLQKNIFGQAEPSRRTYCHFLWEIKKLEVAERIKDALQKNGEDPENNVEEFDEELQKVLTHDISMFFLRNTETRSLPVIVFVCEGRTDLPVTVSAVYEQEVGVEQEVEIQREVEIDRDD